MQCHKKFLRAVRCHNSYVNLNITKRFIMQTIIRLSVAITLLFIMACQQKEKTGSEEQQPVKSTFQGNPDYFVVFYNVENLFDLKDNPDKEDDDFLPGGDKQWTQERYDKKLNDLAKVLSAVDTQEPPELIGLAEVENEVVIEALLQQKDLGDKDYKVIHEQSPDFRGIDVALAYREDAFHYIDHEAIPVVLPGEPNYVSRDILYVKGIAEGADTLHIFVNHWSSRRGGQEASEYKRINAAKILKAHTSEIRQDNPQAKIIIMGDMNDEPSNKSLRGVLKAGNKRQKTEGGFYNLMYEEHLAGKGSYNYRGNWNMLDNIIVSYTLLNNQHGYHVRHSAGKILDLDWMRYNYDDGGYTPNRTYGGPNYYGGISDHFPVYFKMEAVKQDAGSEE